MTQEKLSVHPALYLTTQKS